MKKIFNPKYILYMIPSLIGVALGVLFFLGNSIINYVLGGVCFLCGIIILLTVFLFTPHSYLIDNEGIKIFYRVKKCNFIPWSEIESITSVFEITFSFLYFWKNYVISKKDERHHPRRIDTVTKTKHTIALIEKYWWKSVN